MRGWKRIAEQVVTGILIPAMACSAYSFIVSRDLINGMLFGAMVGAILGGPLCIPVLLAINLQRTWRAVPLLATAATIGVALQIALLGALGRIPAEIAAILDFFWIVPALVGTLAALILKLWETRHESDH